MWPFDKFSKKQKDLKKKKRKKLLLILLPCLLLLLGGAGAGVGIAMTSKKSGEKPGGLLIAPKKEIYLMELLLLFNF